MTKQNSSASAQAGGNNPGNSAAALMGVSGLEALANAVQQLETPTPPEPRAPTEPGADPGPDDPPAPGGEGEAGQNDLTPGDAPPANDAEGGSGNDLSQFEDLAGLDEDTRRHVIELAKAVKAGELQPGEIPRIAKLVGKAHESEEKRLAEQAQIDELKAKIAKLEAGGSGREAEGGSAPELPEAVKKLQTVVDVERREVELKSLVREAERWLRRNPNGGTIGEQEFTFDQIEERLVAFQNELDLLPKRGQQIAQAEQFKSQQAQFKAELHRKLPFLADPNHADTVATRKMLAENAWLNHFANPELEALVRVRGLRSLMAEVKPAARPAAGVPRGKPAGAPGAAAPRPGAGAGIAAAKSQIEKDRSLGSLAALVAASEG